MEEYKTNSEYKNGVNSQPPIGNYNRTNSQLYGALKSNSTRLDGKKGALESKIDGCDCPCGCFTPIDGALITASSFAVGAVIGGD